MTASPLRASRRLITTLPLALLTASCGGLFSNAPVRQLYRSNPTFAFAANLPHSGAQFGVATPTAPAGLDTARIALSRAPETLDYYADAEWTDSVPFLVRTALVEGFEKSATLPAVGPASLGFRADFELETAIADFTAIYPAANGPPRVLVRLDVKLLRLPERRIAAQVSISREADAASNALPEIVRAFDAALGGAVEQIVTWTVGNPALAERRR